MTMCCMNPLMLDVGDTKPLAGNQEESTENRKINKRPTQKAGIASPRVDIKRTKRSTAPERNRPATRPSATETGTATTTERPMSQSVGAAPDPIREITVWPLRSERPKFPSSMGCNQYQYWTG